jgi:hypothetical protein
VSALGDLAAAARTEDAYGVMQVSFRSDAKSSLGDAKSSLGDVCSLRAARLKASSELRAELQAKAAAAAAAAGPVAVEAEVEEGEDGELEEGELEDGELEEEDDAEDDLPEWTGGGPAAEALPEWMSAGGVPTVDPRRKAPPLGVIGGHPGGPPAWAQGIQGTHAPHQRVCMPTAASA